MPAQLPLPQAPPQDDAPPARRRGLARFLGGAARLARSWVVLGLLTLLGLSLWLYLPRDNLGSFARFEADAPYYYIYLVSLIFDGDLNFANQYAITHNWYHFGTTPTGLPSNVFGIGPGLLTAPFFLVGHLVARLLRLQANGFSVPEIRISAFASVAYSFGALVVAWRVCARRLGDGWATRLGPVAVFLGTSIVFYACRETGYAHPFAAFFAALFLDHWDKSFADPQRGLGVAQPTPRSPWHWVGAGLLLGLAALARPQVGLWGVVLLAGAYDDRRRGLGLPGVALRLGLAAAAALLAFAPQLIAWKILYGAWYTVPQGRWFMRWDAPAWSEVLFSTRNGLFAWTPLCALAIVGLVLALRRVPRLAAWLLLGFGLQVIANGAVWDWWAGGSFSSRRFDSTYLAFAVGLAGLLVSAPAAWPRLLRLLSTGVCIAASLSLMVANLSRAGRTSFPPGEYQSPASLLLPTGVPEPFASVTRWLSFAATAPARYAFKWRHGGNTLDYDYVVGLHFLGETYPGLNSFRPATAQIIPLDRPLHHMRGLNAAAGGATMVGESARLLVPLNRRHGPLNVKLTLTTPRGGGDVELRWNGSLLARQRIPGERPTDVGGQAVALDRGVNVLEVAAPRATALVRLSLEVAPNALP